MVERQLITSTQIWVIWTTNEPLCNFSYLDVQTYGYLDGTYENLKINHLFNFNFLKTWSQIFFFLRGWEKVEQQHISLDFFISLYFRVHSQRQHKKCPFSSWIIFSFEYTPFVSKVLSLLIFFVKFNHLFYSNQQVQDFFLEVYVMKLFLFWNHIYFLHILKFGISARGTRLRCSQPLLPCVLPPCVIILFVLLIWWARID